MLYTILTTKKLKRKNRERSVGRAQRHTQEGLEYLQRVWSGWNLPACGWQHWQAIGHEAGGGGQTALKNLNFILKAVWSFYFQMRKRNFSKNVANSKCSWLDGWIKEEMNLGSMKPSISAVFWEILTQFLIIVIKAATIHWGLIISTISLAVKFSCTLDLPRKLFKNIYGWLPQPGFLI